LEALHAGLEGRSRELEAKVGTLETLLSVAMSTNRKLKLKLDEMSVELDVASGSETCSCDCRDGSTHFGSIANYVHSGEGTQAHALASTYRHHIEWVIDSGASKHVRRVTLLYIIHSICSPENYPNC
jgi:hypothetical protein